MPYSGDAAGLNKAYKDFIDCFNNKKIELMDQYLDPYVEAHAVRPNTDGTRRKEKGRELVKAWFNHEFQEQAHVEPGNDVGSADPSYSVTVGGPAKGFVKTLPHHSHQWTDDHGPLEKLMFDFEFSFDGQNWLATKLNCKYA